MVGLCMVPSGEADGSEQETGDGALLDVGSHSSSSLLSGERQTQVWGVSEELMGSKCVGTF